jgi:hypothetical protein
VITVLVALAGLITMWQIGWVGIPVGIAGIAVGVLGGISWIVMGQMIQVFLDVEANTRVNTEIATLLRALVPASAGEQGPLMTARGV